ncbi:hypothetical protein AKJ18_10770 [Vibrio xuii]|nr:hypothetical protein AKJ18_10770 [Vibrio xuii]
MNSINVLVLDTHPIVRDAIVILLKSSEFSVNVFQSDSTAYARKLVRENDIQLILLDVELSDGSGLDLVQRLRSVGFIGKVLFISSGNQQIYNQMAREVGANGYILKSEATQSINEAILATYRGYSVFKQDSNNMRKWSHLSKQESIVYGYLSQGYSNKQISELLSLSSKTVSTYKRRILEKFNASSIIEIMELQKN